MKKKHGRKKVMTGALMVVVVLVCSISPFDNVAMGAGQVMEASEGTAGDFVIENGVLIEYKGTGGDVVVPVGVTKIEDFVFSSCSGLKSIEMPNTVARIGRNSFSACENLERIVIPNGVTSIGEAAFSNCSRLESIEIPASVMSIAPGILNGCNGLHSITVAESNTEYDSRENCNAIIRKEKNELIIGCKNTKIPNGVSSICDDAFYGCVGLESIEIPAGVMSIGQYAFSECKNLTSIIIPNSVTSIGDEAFSGCDNLLIRCQENSVAHKYAVGNGIEFSFAEPTEAPTMSPEPKSNAESEKKETPELVSGDLDGDGTVTLADVAAVFGAALESITSEVDYQESADVDKDGKVTMSDAKELLKVVLGIASE